AGAAVVDATPTKFPVIVNGMFTERSTSRVTDPIQVRALALSDGKTTLTIAVVDSCMVPRDLIDRARAGISNVLVSSTHTHSAPSAMGCLGTDPDPEYPKFLEGRITEALKKAVDDLRPAQAGWTSIAAPKHTYTRRWILRSDKVRKDPFGDATIRANMHPGYQNPDFIGPSGPTDPEMTLLSIRTREGAPLAVLANYSMHYFDSAPLSADYCGAWRRQVEKAMGGGIAIMSQGTSGDQMWMDYGSPKKSVALEDYAAGLSAPAVEALKGVEHKAAVALGASETAMRLRRRTPDAKRLEWARTLADGRKPKTQQEVYAREAVLLHETPEVELRLQALRIGDGLIAAWPNEVFAVSGLKLKAAFPRVMNVSLANGAEGYIPPPEQHGLGGYTTWPARTAALEVGAEPKIVEALLSLMEGLAGAPRRPFVEPETDHSRAVRAAKPTAYWRMGELEAAAVGGKTAVLEGRYALAIEGAVHLVGGRFVSDLPLGETWTVEFRVWRGHGHGAIFDLLAFNPEGRLTLGPPTGATAVALRTWAHVAVVRKDGRTRVWLNGLGELDVEGPGPKSLVLGEGLEGRLDEVAIYARALTPEELRR
ncbi:MAG TPA: hypothetical protein VF950_30630, partial [Planctomycetota bacterium]